MFSKKDTQTICALATPLGEGGIGIIKISGNKALSIVKKIFYKPNNKLLKNFQPWRLNYGFIKDPYSKEKIDEVLVSFMAKPKTYTKENIIEINSHGGPFILEKILKIVLSLGARLAEPGEFTRRAFLNGRINLLEAEATCDLIKTKSEASLRRVQGQLQGNLSIKIQKIKQEIINMMASLEANIDFNDQDIPIINKKELKNKLMQIKKQIEDLLHSVHYDKIYREGINIALVGLPNVGKSSLFNTLIEEQKAIVTKIPGTTRDLIEETIIINGIAVKLTDTAGITQADSQINKESIKRFEKAILGADLILLILDVNKKNSLSGFFKNIKKQIKKEIKSKPIILVGNKIDLIKKSSQLNKNKDIIFISAKTNHGIKKLESKIKKLVLKGQIQSENILVVNLRHKSLLEGALIKIKNSLNAIRLGFTDDLVIIDLQDSLNFILEIVGEGSVGNSEHVLNKIFENFCIGK